MPICFGAALGPRNVPEYIELDHARHPKIINATVTYRCERSDIEKRLPPGFHLAQPQQPSISFTLMHMTQIQWLGGRGYNIFMVTTPATYQGKSDTITGKLELVMFESLADPIITGREELGASKVYAQVSDPAIEGNTYAFTVGWGDYVFARAEFTKKATLPLPSGEELRQQCATAGILNYKYIPKTGCWGEADVEYATYWPTDPNNIVIETIHDCDVAFDLYPGTWEQLPTLQNIVDGLSTIRLGEVMASTLTLHSGQGDVADVRILK